MKTASYPTALFFALLFAGAQTGGVAQNRDPHTFPFRDGDTVVFLGDSITEQRLYTNYIETYLLTRFPTWNLKFRNAGWGGDTSWLRQRRLPFDQALQRDVLSLHPTIVTIDFGMNDAGYQAFNQSLYDQHITGEHNLITDIQKAGVEPVVITPSAVEKSEPGDALVGYNQSLQMFAAGDEKLAQSANVPFADQFTPFVGAINRLRAVLPVGRLSGDVVHPGPAGHLMMADFILSGLQAPSLVSSATVDARNGKVKSDGASVSILERRKDYLKFTRTDDALVFPIDAPARPVLQYVTVADDINRYMIQIDNLSPGVYSVSIDGTDIVTASADRLAGGINLGFYDSPLTDQGHQILELVHEKNDLYFNYWRNVELSGSPDSAAQLTLLAKNITADEQAINALRVPRTYTFVVVKSASSPAPLTTPEQLNSSANTPKAAVH